MIPYRIKSTKIFKWFDFIIIYILIFSRMINFSNNLKLDTIFFGVVSRTIY